MIGAGGRLTRAFKLRDRSAIDVEARTVELAFASEAEVERFFGIERLVVTEEAADLSRLRDGGAVLADHDWRDIVGVVERAWIGDDRVARALVRFGSSARAREVFADVVDGIRKHVSCSYQVQAIERAERRGGVDAFRITRWTPLEISFVSVPADQTVGVGRSGEETETTIVINERTQPMTTTITAERERVRDINAAAESALGRRIKDVDKMARQAVEDGTSSDAFARMVFDRANESGVLATADGRVGMTERDVRRYSITKAIRALGEGRRDEAGFELELSAEAASQRGKETQGLVIPQDVLDYYSRDLSATLGGATGDNLIGTDLLAGQFIDRHRPRSILRNLGVRYLTGLRGDVAIPRMAASSSVAWIDNESYAGADESQPTLDQATATPHTMRGRVDITRKVLIQGTPDAEAMVFADLVNVVETETDRVAIVGSGSSNEPQGIIGADGVAVVEIGDNGGNPAWSHLVDLQTAIDEQNAGYGARAYLTTPGVRGFLKQTPIHETAVAAGMCWQGEGIDGHKSLVSTTVPSDGAKGSGTDLHAILFGDWQDLVVCRWSGLDLIVDPYSQGDKGAIILRVFTDLDVMLRRPESFAAITDADITTS